MSKGFFMYCNTKKLWYNSHDYDGHEYSHNDGSLCDESSKMRKFGIKKNLEDS